jgi:glyoxylate utilization-related uncharacterized protein
VLPLAAPLTGTHPTGRDATVPGFTGLIATYPRVGESALLRAYAFAQTVRVLSGAVLLNIAGERHVLRAGASAAVPATALHSIVPLESGSRIQWEPADAR